MTDQLMNAYILLPSTGQKLKVRGKTKIMLNLQNFLCDIIIYLIADLGFGMLQMIRTVGGGQL